MTTFFELFFELLSFKGSFSDSYLKKKFEVFTDKTEYIVARILAFLSFSTLLIFYTALVILLIFISYKSFTSDT